MRMIIAGDQRSWGATIMTYRLPRFRTAQRAQTIVSEVCTIRESALVTSPIATWWTEPMAIRVILAMIMAWYRFNTLSDNKYLRLELK